MGSALTPNSVRSELNCTTSSWCQEYMKDLLEKTLMLGKIEGGRRRGQQKMRWLDGITDSPGVGDGQGGLACCGSWGRKESDTTERVN